MTVAPSHRNKSFALGVVLFALLACLYLLLYRGHPLSIDEISMFDSVKSLTQHGTLARTIEFYREPTINANGEPFLTPLYEPLQIVTASPFYLLAQTSEHIGQFHAVFLLNVVVTALTAVSLYIIALRHRHTLRTAWVGALLFGTATLALPYSRWLFREPLMSLFALWAFASACDIRVRMTERKPITWTVLVLVGATMAMILTKQAAILFVPGLVICLTPPARLIRRLVPILALLVAAVALFLIIIVALSPDFGDGRYDLLRWLNPANLGLSHMAESFLGYQISPARSFWLYSPILLIGFAGLFNFLRDERRWLAYGIIVTLLLSSASYGALRLGTFWNGGWGWGPRYMLPLVPLWMLFLLPVIERLWRARRWKQNAFGALVLVSIAIQLVGVAVPYTDFYNQYYLQATAETAWLAENWSWQNTAIAYHLRSFSLSSFDSAWRFANPLHVVPLVLLALAGLVLAFGRNVALATVVSRRAVAAGSVLLVALVAVAAIFGLSTLRGDTRYIGNRQDVFDLVQRLNTEVQRDDTLMLSGSEYMVLFMNWLKAGVLFVTLPDDSAFTVEGVTFSEAAGAETAHAVDWAVQRSDTVWLVMSPSAYDAAHPQWYKRYLSSNAYPVGDIAISPFADVERFATGHAFTFDSTETDESRIFGGVLELNSVSTPGVSTFAANSLFPFALRWTVLKPLTENLQLSIQLLNSESVLVIQRDSAPQNGYGATSAWQPGTIYEDRHAIMLAPDLPPGDYRLYLVVYRLDTLARLTVGSDDSSTDALLLAEISVR